MIRSALVIIFLTLISVGFATVIAVFTDKAKAVRWPAAMVAGGVLLAGWLFIFWQNSFHVTTPVVIVALGYVAVVSTVFNLWRTGAAAVAQTDEDEGDASWGLPIGARGELEREKKTLLKAIKEAEFDLQMGKLSKVDADSMIKTFRVRAIEVIKEIEKFDAGAAGSVRERIEREVRARIELEAAVDKKAAAAVAAKQAKKDKKKQRGADKKSDAKAEKGDAKAATAVEADEAKPVEDAASLAATPETAADVAASSDGPSAATTEVATETAASAAEIASVVETPAAAERAAIAEAAAEAATGDTKKKGESSKNESSKNESKKDESKKDESSKNESKKDESLKSESLKNESKKDESLKSESKDDSNDESKVAKADESSKKSGAKEAAS
jgi:hypothetical protein